MRAPVGRHFVGTAQQQRQHGHADVECVVLHLEGLQLSLNAVQVFNQVHLRLHARFGAHFAACGGAPGVDVDGVPAYE